MVVLCCIVCISCSVSSLKCLIFPLVVYILACRCFVVFFFSSRRRHTRLVRSRGLGDVYKRQAPPTARTWPRPSPRRCCTSTVTTPTRASAPHGWRSTTGRRTTRTSSSTWSPTADAGTTRATTRASRSPCLLYTSDAADERSRVDLGGRRIIKKKKEKKITIKKRWMLISYNHLTLTKRGLWYVLRALVSIQQKKTA